VSATPPRFGVVSPAADRYGNIGAAGCLRGFVVTDGPFGETKEALGGYYLVEAADLDEAIHLANRSHAVRRG